MVEALSERRRLEALCSAGWQSDVCG